MNRSAFQNADRHPWPAVLTLPAVTLMPALLEVHQAVQLLASAGQALAEPVDDDSHRAMTWDDDHLRFLGMPLAEGRARVGLRPSDLALQVMDADGDVARSLDLPGRTLSEAYAFTAAALEHVLARPVELHPPDFDIPANPVAAGSAFSAPPGTVFLGVSALYSASHRALHGLAWDRPQASPVVVWPHHFDIATLFTLRASGEDDPGRYSGAGMAPGGGGYDEWYLYVNAWPAPDASTLPGVEGPGHWHTSGWTGRVLTAAELASSTDPEAAVGAFLEDGLTVVRSILGA